jgi:hypothetical protein
MTNDIETLEDDEAVPFFDDDAAVPSTRPKTMVVGNTFIAQTTDQGEVKVRLIFKTKLIRAIRDKGDELDQFIALLDGIGDKKTIEQLDELDIFETTEIVSKFFTAFARRQEIASLGEASGSSS